MQLPTSLIKRKNLDKFYKTEFYLLFSFRPIKCVKRVPPEIVGINHFSIQFKRHTVVVRYGSQGVRGCQWIHHIFFSVIYFKTYIEGLADAFQNRTDSIIAVTTVFVFTQSYIGFNSDLFNRKCIIRNCLFTTRAIKS